MSVSVAKLHVQVVVRSQVQIQTHIFGARVTVIGNAFAFFVDEVTARQIKLFIFREDKHCTLLADGAALLVLGRRI